ncbi:uncharacterized protein LOC110093105 [Dendrobium catenatum]|uniref:uncharacterized protein LOC110093105 n=1 Tax=Dendrobium catenatum TaxID=906689 RepID=UPI0009F3DF11|nr:uncharacterized protein LOC110093105 [Dendrobium catenatum]
MMKKKIRVSKDPSSSSTPYFPDGDEARARFKYNSLFQDFQELLQETKEKRDRLEKIVQKKLQLLAEVKFLKRKFQQFSTTQTVQFKLKKQIHRLPSPSGCVAQPKNPVFQTELPLKRRSQKPKQSPAPTSTAMLDLNQVFLPISEEMEGFEVEPKPLNVDWFKRFSREGGNELFNDSMLSICQDSGIGSKKPAERKVSWQDQLAIDSKKNTERKVSWQDQQAIGLKKNAKRKVSWQDQPAIGSKKNAKRKVSWQDQLALRM